MKTFLRWTAFSMAAALSGFVACSGSGGGCGGTNTNTTAVTPTIITCGPGTIQQGTTCVPTSAVKSN
ncbi:MAG: hypothetical protein KGM24_12700 [Elusimicrobia bacterium]|nr:hypothetical protein [Elusimicrobiota bacterium]